MNQILTKTLQNGKKMPMVGLGTAETLLEKNQMYDLIKSALDKGYRHFDTAVLYENHSLLGFAFNKIFNEQKLYKREDVFITSKLFPVKGEITSDVCKKALEDLNLEYLDLFLVHTPAFQPQGQEMLLKPQHIIWGEMEELVKQNLVQSIGISNYNVQSVFNILSFCEIRPQVNQVEIHPYLMQNGLRQFCKQQDIAITGYANLARGGLEVKKQIGSKIDIFNEPILVELSQKYNVTVAQIVLNYLVKVEDVIVLPKTEKIDRLSQNIDFNTFNLTDEDIKIIQLLGNKQIRTLDPVQLIEWNNFDLFG